MKKMTFSLLMLFSIISVILALDPPVINENFDNVTAPSLPENWSPVVFVSPGNTTWDITTIMENGSYSAHTSPNAGYISNGGTVDGMADQGAFVGLATPQFNSGNYGALLSFWVGGMNPLKVGTMTNLSDTTTFQEFRSIYLDLPWRQINVFIPAHFTGHIVFRHANWYADHDIWIDDVMVSPISAPQSSYTQNFDTVDAPNLPTDWLTIREHDNLNSNTSVKTDNADFFTSPNCLYMKNGVVMGQYLDPNAKVMAITPLLSTFGTGSNITFKAIGQNPIKIGTMNDPTVADSFEEIATVEINADQWTEYNVTIPYQGEVFVAFKHANVNPNTVIRIDRVVFAPVINVPVNAINENFDDAVIPALPMGWSGLLSVSGSNPVAAVQTQTCNAPTQPNGVFLMNGLETSNGLIDGSAFVALVSPYLHIPIQGGVLHFNGAGINTLEVGTLSNPASSESFRLLQSFTMTSEWGTYELALPAGNYFLAFKHGNQNQCTPMFLDLITVEANAPLTAMTDFSEDFDTVTPPVLPENWFSVKAVLASNTVAAVQSMPCNAPTQPNGIFLMNGLDASNGQPDPTAFVALLSPLTQTGSYGAQLTFNAKGFCPIIVGGLTDPLDITTFTEWQTVNINSEWTEYSLFVPVSFNGHIAFKHGNTNQCNPTFLDHIVLTANQPQSPISEFTVNFDSLTVPAIPENWFELKHVLPTNSVAVVQSMACNTPSLPNALFIMNGLNEAIGQPDQTAFVAAVSPNITSNANGSTLTFTAKGGNGLQIGSLSSPYSTDGFSLWQGFALTQEWTQYSMTIPPNFTGHLCFKNDNQTSANPIFIDNIVLAPVVNNNVSVENFESGVFPPNGWTVDNNSWQLGQAIGFSYEGTYYAEIYGNVGGKLKTPVLNIGQNDSLVFYAKNNYWSTTPITILSSTNGTDWVNVGVVQIINTWQRYSVNVGSAQGLKQLAFSKNATDIGICSIDMVTMPRIFTAENNGAVVSVSYPENYYRRENTQMTVNVKIANLGNVAIENAVLNVKIDDTILGTDNLTTITTEDTLEVSVNITLPNGRGYHDLKAVLVYNDENNLDNEKVVPIRYFGQNQMVEGFNENAFPPSGWTLQGEWARYEDIGAYHNEHSYWVTRILGTESGLLYTPKMHIVPGDSISFFSENIITPDGAFLGTVLIKYSVDGINWNTLTELTPDGWPYHRYSVDLSSIAGDKYIGFYKNADGAIYLDYIVGPDFAPQSGDDQVAVSKTGLLGNYPNPFNPSTTIKFDLKKADKTVLEVYNIKGQKVKTLINDTLPAGSHRIVWNGENEKGSIVAGGIYFLKMNTSDYHSVRKMILVK